MKNTTKTTNTPINGYLTVSGSAFTCRFTGVNDKNGTPINESDFIEDVLLSGKIGQVKYGIYFNCFDRKEVKEFGGHVGFYVDFKDDKIRKDLLYWAKCSTVVAS